ncbi:MAG: hypothetical protein ACPLTQ_01645, partial [Anaerolineae bacterium]
TVWGLGVEDRPFVYWGLLLYRLEPDALRTVTGRLRIPRPEARDLDRLPDLRRDLDLLPTLQQPSRIYRLLEPYPTRVLAVGWVADRRARVRARLLAFQTRYRHVTPILTGEDLKAMGLRPGPLFGQLLSALRDARLDGRITTREEEEALVRAMTERSTE